LEHKGIADRTILTKPELDAAQSGYVINQQSELPKRSATEPPDINASREPEIKHSISLFGPPLPTTESQTKISGNIMTSKGVTKGRRNGKAVSAKGKQ
jgi:hypothetical protein